MRTLVLGGARSGKSAWAEALLGHRSGDASDRPPAADGATSAPVDYVATARPFPGEDGFDPDFTARIAEHKRRRPASWRTVDDVDAATAIRRPSPGASVLVDDVGTWLTGVLDERGLWDSPRGSARPWCDELVDAVRAWPVGKHGDGPHLVLVTPEVGMGVIPEHRSGRLFRDEIGLLNGRLAEACDRVVLVAAGLPLALKGPGINY